MSRDPAIADAPLPPLVALRMVAWVIAALFSQILPMLVRRPDLRVPLLRATRTLAMAGWGYARGRDQGELRAAALALAKLLRRILADSVACGGASARIERRVAPGTGRLWERSPRPRARDGPPLATHCLSLPRPVPAGGVLRHG